MTSFAGQIMRPMRPDAFVFPDQFKSLPAISNWSMVPDSNWHRFSFTSNTALTSADLESGRNPPYHYQVQLRWGGENLVVVGEQKEITQYVLKDVFVGLPTRLIGQKVDVNGLVHQLIETPEIYTTTFLHARVSAFGASLRSLSMYGDDITSSNLVLDNLGMFNFQNCGVGAADKGREILRISNSGIITFTAYAGEHYAAIDRLLRFLKIHRFYLG